MNDAIATRNVSLDDGGVVDHYRAAVDHDLDVLAVQGLGFRQLDHILRRHISCDDVIGKDCHQLFFVFGFEQVLHRSRRQLSKCRIGWGKNSERTRPAEGIYQARSLQGCNQGLEVAGCYGGFDDILFRGRVGAASKREQ